MTVPDSPAYPESVPNTERGPGLTSREALDIINLSDEDFHAKYGSPHRDSDGVWCCERHEIQHGDESDIW